MAVGICVAATSLVAEDKSLAAEKFYEEGVVLMDDNSPDADFEGAYSKFLEAAELGHPKAETNVGSMLLNGQGVEKNPAEGAKWIRKAADQNAFLAQYIYAVQLSEGIGMECDPRASVEWFRKAALQGHVASQAELGQILYKGAVGVEPDYEEAAKWLSSAADKGDSGAMNTLGFMNELGHGFPQNAKRAEELYRKAAELGNAKAQSNLGRLYWSGVGVPMDRIEAYRWFKVSSQQGEITAIKLLEKLDNLLSKDDIAEAESRIRDDRAARAKTVSQINSQARSGKTQSDQTN